MRNVILLLLFLSLVACSERTKWKRDLLQLQSEKVTLPIDKMRLLADGRDTIISAFAECSLKLVVYSDSAVCSTCMLSKMHMWDSVLLNISKYEDELKVFFIFSPAKAQKRDVEFVLKKHDFNYPVFLDASGIFLKQNPHIPKDPSLHIFLLDENNRVMMAGHPLLNTKIKALLYQVLEEKLGKKNNLR